MLCVADADVAAAASAARRQTLRFGSCLDGCVALSLAVWHWPWTGCQAVDAMVETIHQAPHLMKILLKPPESVFELLGASVDSLRRDLLVSLLATQPVYS